MSPVVIHEINELVEYGPEPRRICVFARNESGVLSQTGFMDIDPVFEI